MFLKHEILEPGSRLRGGGRGGGGVHLLYVCIVPGIVHRLQGRVDHLLHRGAFQKVPLYQPQHVCSLQGRHTLLRVMEASELIVSWRQCSRMRTDAQHPLRTPGTWLSETWWCLQEVCLNCFRDGGGGGGGGSCSAASCRHYPTNQQAEIFTSTHFAVHQYRHLTICHVDKLCGISQLV